MEEDDKLQIDQLIQSAPGGIAKLAFDDMLTILYATDKFYSLIKNVSDKITTKTPLALLRIVYSADLIYVTQQLAAQKSRKDNMIHINFRTLQPNGSFKWVMITGNKTEETYISGSKTVPVYACVAMDITQLMANYKKLEQTNEYHRTITELSKELYFEYEIATDTLSFTELFREVFGKDSTMTGFRKKLEKAKMIHPDEQPAVVAIFNSMMGGRKQVRFELRLITKDGTPTWYICYASIIFDENRNPYKVVGKLSTTKPVSAEPEKHKRIPALDAQTNVCTKDSAEVMIKEAMEDLEADSLTAFMLIDIRNYKGINEIRKIIHGENVFTTVSSILKSHFRTSDIIGRVSLSEFVVYIKDIQSDKAVYELANQICSSINGIYSFEHTKSTISASIGISLQLGRQEYQTMLTSANAALIMAKKVPTSSFEVFSGTL